MATVATCFATVLLQPAHLAVDDIKVQRKDISLLRELIMNYAALFTTNQQLQFIERWAPALHSFLKSVPLTPHPFSLRSTNTRDGNLLVRYATLSKIVEKLVDESYSGTASGLMTQNVLANQPNVQTSRNRIRGHHLPHAQLLHLGAGTPPSSGQHARSSFFVLCPLLWRSLV